jgi:hypothetical protein
MFAACFLLAIATVSGSLLTFLYDRSAPFPARFCMGATTGMVLFAAVGFLLALWLGLGPVSISLAVLVMLLPFLLLARKDFRAFVTGEIGTAVLSALQAARRPTRRTFAYVVFYCGLTVLLSAVFAAAAYETPEGIFTAVRNNLGDLPLHLQVINSFAQGHNLPPEDPTFAGVRFAYPFMVDFLAAMLMKTGAGPDIISAMWAENMFAALSLVGMVHYWTWLLTRSRLAGFLAPLLVLFGGGLGWAQIFQDVHESEHGLLPLLASLPHSYTIMDVGGILRWGNSLTTLFAPQRSILFGMPLAIVIFCQWWLAVGDDSQPPTESASQPNGTRRMLSSGIFAGLMPLLHAHTFLVVMGVGACLALIFNLRQIPRKERSGFQQKAPARQSSLTPSSASSWRPWLLFFATVSVVALPQLRWLAGSGGVKISSYLGWQPGWDHSSFNPVIFWLANTGLFIPLLLLALLSRSPGFALPRRVLMFYAPFLLCFILPNLFKFAPWIWDNIKVLFWWYVASVPLVAFVIAQGFKQRRGARWLAAGALVTLLLAGALDVLAVVTEAQEFREFDRDAIAIAQRISARAAPRAVVLHAPGFNSPVFLTGRRSLMGYAGWMWSRGLDASQRQADIQRMYAGTPDAAALLRQYQVDYVLIGPAELTSLNVNPQFWSQYSLAAHIGPYQLYQIAETHEKGGP